MPELPIAVVGGGVIGAGIAYELARAGAGIVLIEQKELASGCSGGSAGQITPGHTPLCDPQYAKAGFAAMFDSRAAFYFEPRCDCLALAWLHEFCRRCVPAWREAATAVLAQLGHFSFDVFQEWKQTLGAEAFDFHDGGRIEVARDDATAQTLQKQAQRLGSHGFTWEWLSADKIAARAPLVTGPTRGGVYYPQSGYCDPRRLTLALASAAQKHGAIIRERTAAVGLREDDGKGRAAVVEICPLHESGTTTGSHERVAVAAVVLATGAWRSPLWRQAGLTPLMEPGKGYHLDYPWPAFQGAATRQHTQCAYPLVLAAEKIYVTPLVPQIAIEGTPRDGFA